MEMSRGVPLFTASGGGKCQTQTPRSEPVTNPIPLYILMMSMGMSTPPTHTPAHSLSLLANLGGPGGSLVVPFGLPTRCGRLGVSSHLATGQGPLLPWLLAPRARHLRAASNRSMTHE